MYKHQLICNAIPFHCSHRRIQSCSTPISHRNGTVPPLSIPARTFRLIPAKQAIPPPPPYHASVRNAIHRNEINQITTQIQQSCSTNVFNVSASSSSSTLTTNINAINASSSAVYLNRNSVKRLENNAGDEDANTITNNNNTNTTTNTIEASEQDPTNTDELANSNEFSHEVQDEAESISRDDDDDDDVDDVDDDENDNDENDSELINQNEIPCGRSVEQTIQRPKQHKDICEPAPEIVNKNPRGFKEETIESTTTDIENVNDKKTRGLKVLSNVQVSPNAILNVSLNTTNSETIPLNNMIIVSSIPSTSTGTTSQVIPTQLVRSQSLLKSLQESRSLSSDPKNPKHTKVNVEVSYRRILLLERDKNVKQKNIYTEIFDYFSFFFRLPQLL